MNAREQRRPVRLEEIYRLRPWYHDFGELGLVTDFESGLAGRARRLLAAAAERLTGEPEVEKGARHPILSALRPGPPSHRMNQRVKERALVPLLEKALASLGGSSGELRALDLFCADGYYSCRLARMAPDARVFGIDLDSKEIERARAAARALGLVARFEVADVLDPDLAAGFLETETGAATGFDLVLCLGGLYHLDDPVALIRRLRELVAGRLVVQSVVSMANEAPEYFESPAPGWRHGSRFSHRRLALWLEACGFEILEERRGELPGNRRSGDRGASYFLCRPAVAGGPER